MMKAYTLSAALLAILVGHGEGNGTTIHVRCAESGRACGEALQTALDDAPAGSTITLEAGKVYEGAFVIKPRAGVGDKRPLSITTAGWRHDGTGWDGLVTPADKGRMAVLRGAPRSTATLTIPEGTAYVRLVGVAFEATPPAGRADLIRIGTGDAPSAASLPHHVTIQQVLLQGDRRFGQRRGIAANGADIEIAQVWCEEIFTAGQDSQCVGGWSGAQRVRLHHSYLAAGSENILVGGAPIRDASLQPHDWLVEDVILHKPLRWKQDGQSRQVKNLLEFKHGYKLTARRILAVNTWRAAQSGRGLLFNYTTNGRCPACGNLEQVLVEDVVMLNTEEGVSFQGYSYQPDSHSRGKLRDITLRNLYVHLSAPGRLFQISNVRGHHGVRIERSTFLNEGTSWLVGSFGRAWSDDHSLVDGGPMQGLFIANNVFTANGDYGVTAPDRRHYGSGLEEFVEADLQVSGNVIGGAPPEHLANYNEHTAGGAPNVAVSQDKLRKTLTARTCGQWAVGKGADCERLTPIFGWLKRLPEP
jgi:hypothetical protein